MTPCPISKSRLAILFRSFQEAESMTHLRQYSVLVVILALTSVLRADDKPPAADKPASPWAIDQSVSIAPQAAPMPALKYRLLPGSWELKDGNAVPIYLRLTHEQSDASRKYFTETPKQWNALPLDKIPTEEARKFLQDHHYLLRQLEVGARRRTAEWNYTLDEPNPIGLLLPDMQWMRNYTPMLILQARVALAQGDFSAAAHHLETGFAFSQHVAEGPTLINSLVGYAIASEFVGAATEFIQRTDAPNLYWALTALPRPLIDLRPGFGFEYQTFEKQFPELGDLDRERTAEQWESLLQRTRTEMREVALEPAEGSPGKLPDWFPKDCAPGDPASKSPDLSLARQYVARTRGLAADKVEMLPPAQVLLLYVMGTYQDDRDDWYRASYLPYPQARPLLAESINRLHDMAITEGHVPARLFLPSLNNVISRQIAIERRLTALRVIEALRMHCAAHDGQLPNKLADVSEVPIPDDPGTGQPFEYHCTGDTATLVSQIPGTPSPANGQRYQVTIRKK
jgi:hypothetical protein